MPQLLFVAFDYFIPTFPSGSAQVLIGPCCCGARTRLSPSSHTLSSCTPPPSKSWFIILSLCFYCSVSLFIKTSSHVVCLYRERRSMAGASHPSSDGEKFFNRAQLKLNLNLPSIDPPPHSLTELQSIAQEIQRQKYIITYLYLT